MAAPTTTLPPAPPAPARRRFTSKHILWLFMGLAAVWVFISVEVLLAFDYPLYHPYRLLLIHDRAFLIPHALGGTVALLSGPIQFSSRIRARYPRFHRILGRVYVAAVFTAAPLGILMSWHNQILPGNFVQASVWMICTLTALLTARNRQFAAHRLWMIRSYGVTFTFIALRILTLWPRYNRMTQPHLAITIIVVTFAMLLGCDIALTHRELTHRRA